MEGSRVRDRPGAGKDVGRHTGGALDDAEIRERLEGLVRVGVKLPLAIDPRQPGPLDEIMGRISSQRSTTSRDFEKNRPLAVAHFVSGRPPAFHSAFALLLPDNDDAMRLVTVRDLLAAQSWFDPVQHRMRPAEGAAMHWSRFVDAPIAALILALRTWFNAAPAERIVVAFWPPLVLAVYLCLTAVGTFRLFGFRAACFATAAACVLPKTTGLFEPGRIDHHNIQAVAIAGAALCAAGGASRVGLAAMAGGLGGFSLAVGLETFPFLACLGSVYALFWIRDGGREARPFAAFAAALLVGSALFFLAQTGSSAWLVDRCGALSRPWITLAAGSAVAVACLASATPWLRCPRDRMIAASGLGLVAKAIFAVLHPACLAGPFENMPAVVRSEWLNKVTETTGVLAHATASPQLVLGFFCPVIVAACFATHGALGAPAGERRAGRLRRLSLDRRRGRARPDPRRLCRIGLRSLRDRLGGPPPPGRRGRGRG